MEKVDVVYREPDLQFQDLVPEQRNKYFRGGHWARSIDLLQHLCQYSSQVIYVKGKAGLGKTTMLQAFLEEQDGAFKCCSLDAQAKWDAITVLHQVATGFGLDWQRDINFDVDSITAAAVADDKIWVLLIDGAQVLSIEALRVLFSIVGSGISREDYANNALISRLHLVLLATPELEPRLKTISMQQIGSDSLQIINLEPLPTAEVGAYLQHKWHLVGNQIPLPFDQATIKKIGKLAQGNPKEIERLASNALAGEKMIKSRRQSTFTKAKYPVVVGVSIFALLTGWIILSHDSAPDASSKQIFAANTAAVDKGASYVASTNLDQASRQSHAGNIEQTQSAQIAQIQIAQAAKAQSEQTDQVKNSMQIEQIKSGAAKTVEAMDAMQSSQAEHSSGNDSAKTQLVVINNTTTNTNTIGTTTQPINLAKQAQLNNAQIAANVNPVGQNAIADQEQVSGATDSSSIADKSGSSKTDQAGKVSAQVMAPGIAQMQLPEQTQQQPTARTKTKLEELREAVAMAKKRERASATAANGMTAKQQAGNSVNLAATIAEAIADKEITVTKQESVAKEKEIKSLVTQENILNTTKEATVANKSSAITEPLLQGTETNYDTLTNKNTPSAKVLSASEKAILALPKKSYTLQLLATNNLQGMRQIINDYGLQDKVYSYRAVRDGKDWHILVYGSYADYNAAKQAMQALPVQVQKMLQGQRAKPWAKSVDSIHKELEQRA